ncbi:MAG: hypothetical protein K6U74_18005 [Firmicutes bacterium]|nr:hypothetical protein [Bacillota bacterium]
MQTLKKVVLPILLVLVVGVGTFYLGVWYQKSQAASIMGSRGRFDNTQGQSAGNQARRFFGQGQGRPFAGEIISKDSKSITIKLRDGSSKIVMLPDKATIRKFTAGSREDLKQGGQVLVIGEENADGSITASTVQIGPMGM